MHSSDVVNESVFALFKLCLAALVYHRDFLDNSINSENAFCISPFWSEVIPFSEHATTRYPWNQTVDTPEFTGLPVDVIYMAKVESLHMELESLKVALVEDNRHIVEEITINFKTSLDMW